MINRLSVDGCDNVVGESLPSMGVISVRIRGIPVNGCDTTWLGTKASVHETYEKLSDVAQLKEKSF